MKYLLSFIICLVPAVFCQKPWESHRYPDPMQDVNDCGRRGQKSHICDPDQILSNINANQIEKELQKFTNETTCRCSGYLCSNAPRGKGYTMGIALMKKMKMDDSPAIQKMIENANSENERKFRILDVNLNSAHQFAFELLTKWELGRCKDDLMLIYSEDDNILYTFTGELTAKRLNPSDIAEITMRHRPLIGPNRNTLNGLRGIIKDFKAVLNEKYNRNTYARYTAETAAMRSRRSENGATPTSTAAVLVTSLLSLLASLSLH